MKRLVVLFIATTALSVPNLALAWGKWGHVTLCELTYRLLTDDARVELNKIIVEHPAQKKLKTNPKRVAMTSYNYACLYADKNEFGQRVESPRHFLNLDRSDSDVSSEHCPDGKTCILDGIKEEQAILLDTKKPDAKRADALVMIGHWVGDLHQPLHVSFSDDLGGNQISKLKRGRCQQQNLHGIWDTCILEIGLFKNRVADFFKFNREKKYSTKIYRYVDDLEKRYTKNQMAGFSKAWLDTKPIDWANESYNITLSPSVEYCVQKKGKCRYDDNRVKRPKLGVVKPRKKASTKEKREYKRKQYEHNKKVVINDDYIRAHSPIVEKRLMQAAMRLADIINTGLDQSYKGEPDFSRFQ